MGAGLGHRDAPQRHATQVQHAAVLVLQCRAQLGNGQLRVCVQRPVGQPDLAGKGIEAGVLVGQLRRRLGVEPRLDPRDITVDLTPVQRSLRRRVLLTPRRAVRP